ncbi:MAG TPA: LysR family transcriptional regulator [Streptosporangiaceae bacterium]
MLDVTRLRVLVAVARHGSVTAAARALNYAQPSVSHHLARLEAETGTRLIQRSGRSVRLTDAGRLLAGRAEEILGRLAAAEHELAAHVGQQEERIRLAGFPSALATLVPAAAARLRADHPGVELLLTETEPHEALRMLKGGRADVALVFRFVHEGAAIDVREEEVAGTRAKLLLDEPFHVITPAASPWPPTGGGMGLAPYAKHRWIAGCERCRAQLLWLCEMAGFTPQIASTTDDVLVAQALAAAGLGVAILPDLALRAARHPGIRTEELPGARRHVLALTYGEPPDPPGVGRLLDALTLAAAPKQAATPSGPRPMTARVNPARSLDRADPQE